MILVAILIIISGMTVFKVSNNNILVISSVVIMMILILWQDLELQKDKERLKLLRSRERGLDKEIKRLNKIEKEFNLQNKE